MERMLLSIGVFLLAICVKEYNAAITLASYYSDSMVLQSAPAKSIIWGLGDEGAAGHTVTITFNNKIYTTTLNATYFPDRTWWGVLLDPTDAGGSYTIKVEHNKTKLMIQNVTFGDVWICAGEDNMDFQVSKVDDGDKELSEAENYPDIRIFATERATSDQPLADLRQVRTPWTLPTRETLGAFSGVCWLYGKHIYKALRRPIGLIQSSWGGTWVESWAPKVTVDKCPWFYRTKKMALHSPVKTQKVFQSPVKKQFLRATVDKNYPSAVYNAMIHPFATMSIKGAIFYQGKSDQQDAERYKCLFPSMIEIWRDDFNKGSLNQTAATFPFGFVQLAPYRSDPNPDTGYADIRWSQTAHYGQAPNSELPSVFMAVAADLPDFNSPYGASTPRYKQDIGKCLSIAGLAVAYGQNVGRWQGPYPTNITSPAENTLKITFDNGSTTINFTDPAGFTGFELCCSSNGEICTDFNVGYETHWVETTVIALSSSYVVLDSQKCSTGERLLGIRYIWRESPCSFKNCPVYSVTKENSLPTPPFIYFANFTLISS